MSFLRIAKDIGLKQDPDVKTSDSGFFSGKIKLREELYDMIMNTKEPKHNPIMVFGKVCQPNRDCQLYVKERDMEKIADYDYSNSGQKAKPMPLLYEELMDLINEMFGISYNSILVNVYNNGEEYIGSHSDKDVGSEGVVMLVCGAARKFRFRTRSGKMLKDIIIPDCTLAWMAGEFQKHFKHEVPVEKSVKEKRVSLTFRKF